MRKLYKALFYVPKFGKVQDRVMTARAVVSLSVILLCLASMAITAYAWFSYNVTSANNRITAAHFGTDVVIVCADGNTAIGDRLSGGGLRFDLTGGQTYEVTVSLTEGSTAQTGFCILSGETIGTWHTWQLGVDGNIQRQLMTFYLQPTEDMQIVIRDCWGTSSSYGNPNATNRVGEGHVLILPQVVFPPTTVPPTTVPATTVPTTTVPSTTVFPTTVPPTGPETTVPPVSEIIYVIQEGDYLTAIAERYGILVEELCRINGIENPDVILTGDTLRIPVVESEGGEL